MKIYKVGSVIVFLLFLSLLVWLIPIDMLPTLLLLAICAWLNLDSLLHISILGKYFERVSIDAFGAFQRQVTWLTLGVYVALAMLIAIKA